jgi:hypothetical protein
MDQRRGSSKVLSSNPVPSTSPHQPQKKKKGEGKVRVIFLGFCGHLWGESDFSFYYLSWERKERRKKGGRGR